MKLNEKYKSLLNSYNVNTPLRLAHFMAQIEHESGLKPISENLNYSASGLIRVFRKRFTDLEAIQYANQPERIANKVYGNRMGNGNEASGDGWKYRGRGFLQITGKDNYSGLSLRIGIDLLGNPDLLLTEANSMIGALWFWERGELNKLADQDDLKGITRKVNGGFNGLAHRQELLTKWKKSLKI